MICAFCCCCLLAALLFGPVVDVEAAFAFVAVRVPSASTTSTCRTTTVPYFDGESSSRQVQSIAQRRVLLPATLRTTDAADEAVLEDDVASSTATSSSTFRRDLLESHIRDKEWQEAEDLLSLASSAQPSVEDYNLLLIAYAKHGLLVEAERLVTGMAQNPNVNSYNALLDALDVVAGKDDAATTAGSTMLGDRAELYLQSILDLNVQDPVLYYNKVLRVYKNDNRVPPKMAKSRAGIVFQQLVDKNMADVISYTTYIGILANIGTIKSAQHANDIADTMLRNYYRQQRQKGKGKKTDTDEEEEEETDHRTGVVKPNTSTWSNVISAWVKCGQVQKAEQILGRMEDTTDLDLVPDVVSYATVMDGWAKFGKLDRMEQIYERMEEAYYRQGNVRAKPNFWTFVVLIQAYAKHGQPQKAQDHLFQLYKQYQKQQQQDVDATTTNDIDDDCMKPNTKLATAVMDGWRKSGSFRGPERAEALLDWMISVEDEDLMPNEFSFNAAITAWGRSRKLGKAVKARNILNKMIQLYESGRIRARPNTVCYTAVINACAYCENDDIDKRDALRIAVATYKELEKSKYGRPNQVTYSSLLTALRNLLPTSPKRSIAVQDVFLSAAKNGFVDQMVVRRAMSALGQEELESIFPLELVSKKEDILVQQLPREWWRNVELSR